MERAAGWRRLERLAFGLGALLLIAFGAIRLHAYLGSRRDLARFQASVARGADAPSTAAEEPPADFRLWSPERVKAYRASLREKSGEPLAVLRIPSIDLEVAVLAGTDEVTLNRAVGWIAGTARPGETGNVGVAGHRDGFFRGLKDLGPGESIELETHGGRVSYCVDEIRIVRPEAVEVLAPTAGASLTLVTCYPFYFVGSAPERYIVKASREPATLSR
jgi:sortase A